MKLILFVLATFICSVQSLYIPISQKPICMILLTKSSGQTKFYYQVVGATPENFQAQLISEYQNTPSVFLTGQRGQTTFRQTKMTVCLSSTDSQSKSVSIDYHTQDSAHIAQLASKSQMRQLHQKLVNVGMKVKDVFRGEIFEEQKNSIHSRIIQEQQSKIQTIVVVKVIAILVVAVGQIYLLKVMLNNQKKQGYQVIN